MSEHLHEVAAPIEDLKKRYPSEINAFVAFMDKAEAGPALTLREKELINVGRESRKAFSCALFPHWFPSKSGAWDQWEPSTHEGAISGHDAQKHEGGLPSLNGRFD
jgi:hypothetical protein